MKYELPDAVRVEADGPVRIVRLSRPEQLNAVNDDLHLGLTRVNPGQAGAYERLGGQVAGRDLCDHDARGQLVR